MPISNEMMARRVAARHMAAVSDGSKLPGPVRKKVNLALTQAGFDGNGRFHSTGQAVAKAAEVLAKFDIEWGEVLDSFRLRQPSGRMTIDLASRTEDPFSPVDIQNTALAFQWTSVSSGIEVIAYLG